MFSLNINGLQPLNDEKGKTVFALIEILNASNRKLKKYGLIKEENFTINLCKNGYATMIF